MMLFILFIPKDMCAPVHAALAALGLGGGGHDRVVRKEELLEALWPGQFVGDVGLNTYIMEVRKALRDRRPPHQYIRTVRGQGYRFVAPVEVRASAPPQPAESLPVQEAPPPLLPGHGLPWGRRPWRSPPRPLATGGTLSWSWTRRSPCCASGAG
jgi:hypothetical protein